MDAISDWERPFSQEELDEIDAVIASVTTNQIKPSQEELDEIDAVVASVTNQIKPQVDNNNRVPLNNRRLPNWTNPRYQVRYPEMKFRGRIVYCKTVSEVEKASKELFEIIQVKQMYMEQVSLGFDIEWKPTFRKGEKIGKAAVVQICGDPGLCYVMHIHHSGIPPVLQSLLEDPTSVKVGVAIGGDAVKIFKDYNICVRSLEDLSDLANIKLGGIPKMWGLNSLAETLVHEQIKKPGHTRLGNWETRVLSKQQLEYAALDAFASWHLYQVLQSFPDPANNNVPADEVNDSSPILHHEAPSSSQTRSLTPLDCCHSPNESRNSESCSANLKKHHQTTQGIRRIKSATSLVSMGFNHVKCQLHSKKGLLFRKPSPSLEDPDPNISFINQLKHSLSVTLTHFYPLSGRLATRQEHNPPFYAIYLDYSSDSVGAEFIHASVDLSMMDILTPIDVPRIVQSLFALEGAIGHDGHTEPLLAVQVTELLDGIFVGVSFNHTVGDGTSYWNFFNSFAEITRTLRKTGTKAGDCSISHPPITKRLFLEGHRDAPLINLPFSHHKEFIGRHDEQEQPQLRERMFHFTAESMAKLKAKANEECEAKHVQISSFQALSALVWKSIAKARNFPSDSKTSCKLAINNRWRLNPPLSENYFGNCIYVVSGTATSGEIIKNGIGWAALLLHQAVKEHTDLKIRGSVDEWIKKPFIVQRAQFIDASSVVMGSSPRFDMYGCDFGLGKAVAARSGYANKFDGKVSSYPGLTGTGSVMLEVCLPPELMDALESDEEFMEAVSPHEIHLLHLA